MYTHVGAILYWNRLRFTMHVLSTCSRYTVCICLPQMLYVLMMDTCHSPRSVWVEMLCWTVPASSLAHLMNIHEIPVYREREGG